ncbi:hypothetical protein AB0N71_08960 [Pseudarthrobacter enclensis]|uniref:hypothetical protein n=1 Tax=Pseudarthrobacter enclensis TaxID=993070 RepID=UPI003436D276
MSDQEKSETIAHRVDVLAKAYNNLRRVMDELPELLRPITPKDGIDQDALNEVLRLTRDFLDSDVVKRTYTHSPADVRGRQPINQTFVDTLDTTTKTIARELVRQENLSVVGWSADQLKRALGEALERSQRKEFAFLTVPEQAQLDTFALHIGERLRQMDEKKALASAAQRAEEAATNAAKSASAASSAAGKTADNEMASFYEKLGSDEQATANLFRRWAIGLGAVAGALAWTFLSGGAGLNVGWLEIAAGDYVHLIQRGLVLAAFLALATYLAKQAHQHRSMANWARSLAVQLKTFDAFLDAIKDSSVQDELRKTFAARVFGDHPAVKGEPALSASSQSMAALTEALAKLVPAGK